MSEGEGPWSQPPPPPAPRGGGWPHGRWRTGLWLGVIAVAAAAILGLAALFPGQISSGDQTWLWLDFAAFVVISRGVLFMDPRRLRGAGRHVLIWAGVVAVAVLIYALRNDLMTVAARVRSEIAPAYAVASAPHTLAVSPSDDGHYYVVAQVNGVPVRFLLDTGASDIVLSPNDARRAGIDPSALAYRHPYATANGAGFGAGVTIGRLSIGALRLERVEASVNRAPMDSSLLGMTFFRRMESFEVKDGRLMLHWRS